MHDRVWDHITSCEQFYIVPCRTHDLNEVVFEEDLPQSLREWKEPGPPAKEGSR